MSNVLYIRVDPIGVNNEIIALANDEYGQSVRIFPDKTQLPTKQKLLVSFLTDDVFEDCAEFDPGTETFKLTECCSRIEWTGSIELDE